MTQAPTDPNPTPPPDTPGASEPGLDAAQQSLSDALRVSFGVLKVLMIVLFVVYLGSGVIRVDEQNTAVRYRFGEEIGTYGPGWHFGLPFPIEQVVMVPRNTQTLRVDKSFWYDNPEDLEPAQLAFQPLNPLNDSFLITGDTNVIHVQFEVTYVIEQGDVNQYLRNVGSLERANELVQTAVERGMIHAIASSQIDDIVSSSDYPVNEIVQRTKDVLTKLDTGITIQQVLIDNKNQSMPNQVREAYLGVTQAQADKVRIIQEARQTYDQTLGAAAGGAHGELLTMIRAYEAALGSGEDELAHALRTELDRSIRDLLLPELALLEQISAYRNAVTQATQSDDDQSKAAARAATDALAKSLAELDGDRALTRPIAGEIAAAISLAKARRSEISSRAEREYKRYASALDAYNKTPLVLANDRLQATRERVMNRDTLKFLGLSTRINTTFDPVDVDDINNVEADRRREEAAEQAREER